MKPLANKDTYRGFIKTLYVLYMLKKLGLASTTRTITMMFNKYLGKQVEDIG